MIRNRLMDFAAPDLVPPLPTSRAHQIDGLSLLFGDDQPEMIQVQEGGAGARRAPDPVNQDGLRGYQPKNIPPAKREAEPPKLDGLDLLFGDGQAAPAAPAPTGAPAIPDPNAEPDASTWIGRRWQDIRGRTDPRYKGLGDVVSDNPEVFPLTDQSAIKMAAPGDEAYHDIIKQQLGPNYIRTETDANGSKVMVYKDLKTGAERKSYVNRPGLDWQDFDRAMYGTLPYLVTGGVAGRLAQGAPLAARALIQGGVGAATSAGQDVAAGAMGSEQGVDAIKMGVAGGAGAVGELAAPAVGALWRRFVTEPKYFNRATGQLTQEGERLAKQAGIDPGSLTDELAKTFAKTYAKTGDEAAAAFQAQAGPLNIPATVGQRTKDPQQLLQEKAMRQGLFGQQAKERMTAFDEQQKEAVGNAVLGSTRGGVPRPGSGRPEVPGLTRRVAPDRPPGEYNKESVGAGIQGSAKAAKDAAKEATEQAWAKVGPLEPTDDAFKLLPTVINKKLDDVGGVAIDDAITPAAAKMAKELDQFMAGEAPGQVAKILDNSPVRTVNQMRKRMLGISKGAATPEDRRAAAALYDGFNDWIDQAASAQLLKGDPASAANMVTARGLHREMMQVFNGAKGTPQARILEQVFGKADSPENVINALFTGPTAEIKQGSAAALANLKQAFDKYLPKEQAASAWGDVKLAYVLKIAQDKQGRLQSPQNLLNNIQRARSTQGSLFNTLLTPQERQFVANLEKALERIVWRDPNPSGTATAAANLMKQFLGTIWDAIGIKSQVVRTAIEASGLGRAYGAASASRAVDQSLRGLPAPTLGQYGAAAGSQSQN